MFRSTDKCVFNYKLLHFLAYDAFSIDIYSGLCCHVLQEKNFLIDCFIFIIKLDPPMINIVKNNKRILD